MISFKLSPTFCLARCLGFLDLDINPSSPSIAYLPNQRYKVERGIPHFLAALLIDPSAL